MNTSQLVTAVFGILAVGLVHAADVKSDSSKPTTNTGPTEYNGKTLKEWVQEIEKNPDPGFRQRAILALTVFDPEMASKEASPALIKCFSDGDTSIRVNSLIAIALIGVHKDYTKEAVKALLSRIKVESQSVVRLHIIVVMGDIGPEAREVIPVLIDYVNDPASYEIRRASVVALAGTGASDGKNGVDMRAVQAICQVVAGGFAKKADSSAEVRLAGVTALGLMGVPQNPAEKTILVNGLKAGMKDKEKIIQIWSRVSLMRVEGVNETYLKELSAFIRGNDDTAKVEAIKAVGALGVIGDKQAAGCLADLQSVLFEKDLGLVCGAAWALSEWGDKAEKSLPDLQKLHDAKDTDERIKPVLKAAMERISGKKKP
jgi:HEAT repeat protein